MYRQRLISRSDSQTNWTAINPTLAAGEIITILDEQNQPAQVRIGGGKTAPNSPEPRYTQLPSLGGNTPRPLQRGVFVYPYEPGLYGDGLIVVAIGTKLYKLRDKVIRPYQSIDFAAELARQPAIWEPFNGGSGEAGDVIENLSTAGSTLNVATNNGDFSVDLLPAIEQLVIPPNNANELLLNNSFNGDANWLYPSNAVQIGNGVIHFLGNTNDDNSYARQNINPASLDVNSNYLVEVEGDDAEYRVLFAAPPFESRNVTVRNGKGSAIINYYGSGAFSIDIGYTNVNITKISLRKMLSQAVYDNYRSLLLNARFQGNILGLNTNNGYKNVDLSVFDKPLTVRDTVTSANSLVGSFISPNFTDNVLLSIGRTINTNGQSTLIGHSQENGIPAAFMTVHGLPVNTFKILGSNGYVGFNKSQPSERIDVDGNVKAFTFKVNAMKALMAGDDGNSIPIVQLGDGETSEQVFIRGNSIIRHFANNHYLHNKNGELLTSVNGTTGAMGIGTTTPPNEKLEVNGNIKANQFKAVSGFTQVALTPTSLRYTGDNGSIGFTYDTILNKLTISGNLSLRLAPTEDNHAVPKSYVDGAVSGKQGAITRTVSVTAPAATGLQIGNGIYGAQVEVTSTFQNTEIILPTPGASNVGMVIQIALKAESYLDRAYVTCIDRNNQKVGLISSIYSNDSALFSVVDSGNPRWVCIGRGESNSGVDALYREGFSLNPTIPNIGMVNLFTNTQPLGININANYSEVGTFFEVTQMGVAPITLLPASGVTLQAYQNVLTTSGQYASLRLHQIAKDVWRVTSSAAPTNVGVQLTNVATDPATNAQGGVLYVKNGALLFKGGNGTVTTLALA
jgi:hypothetical protein